MKRQMAEIVTLTMNPSIDVSTSIGHLVPNEKLRCAPETRDAGGGGVNVARAVVRLGGEARALYPAGGVSGQLLHQLVVREGVIGIPVAVDEETRQDFTIFEKDSGQQYRFVLPGLALKEAEWKRCLESIEAISPHPSCLVISGTLPPGVPADFHAKVVREAKAWNCRVFLDTSGAPLRAALAEGVYLVKPNRKELEELTGQVIASRQTRVAACRSIISAGGAEVVALTLGSEGAMLVTRDVCLVAKALEIRPATTVGAGDCFLGGLVQGLVSGLDLQEAFRLAVAAGSAALLRPGTGLCRKEDVDRLLPQVTLES